MKCVRKEQYECIYLTKQNREEVLKIFEPNIDGEYIYLSKKIMTGIVLLNISVGIDHITSIIGGMF